MKISQKVLGRGYFFDSHCIPNFVNDDDNDDVDDDVDAVLRRRTIRDEVSIHPEQHHGLYDRSTSLPSSTSIFSFPRLLPDVSTSKLLPRQRHHFQWIVLSYTCSIELARPFFIVKYR